MTKNPITLAGTDSLAQAKALMRGNRIRHIPIVDQGLLTGLITLKDLLAAEESNLLTMNPTQRQNNEEKVRIEEFMKSNLVTVDEQTSVREAALHLSKHKLGCLPVVNRGKLVGIITDSDFVNVAINLLELADQQEMVTNDW